jgi:hypothetical protein
MINFEDSSLYSFLVKDKVYRFSVNIIGSRFFINWDQLINNIVLKYFSNLLIELIERMSLLSIRITSVYTLERKTLLKRLLGFNWNSGYIDEFIQKKHEFIMQRILLYPRISVVIDYY